MTEKQTTQLLTVADIANGAGIQAIEHLDIFIKQLQTAKSLANNLRWRITSVTDPKRVLAPAKPNKIIDADTKAEGYRFTDIDDTFYTPAHAARYIKTNEAKIVDLVDTGKLYSVKICGIEYVPEKALLNFKNTRS